jgi:Flp pilus assembly protein TadB
MNTLAKTLKPTCKLLVAVLLLMSFFHQSASAAMIGTEQLLPPDRNQKTRDHLHQLIARENIREALAARGIDPDEAEARIDSLTDDETELIAGKIDALPAGGNIAGFVLICAAVILIVFLIVEYTSSVKMFPQFQFGD